MEHIVSARTSFHRFIRCNGLNVLSDFKINEITFVTLCGPELKYFLKNYIN